MGTEPTTERRTRAGWYLAVALALLGVSLSVAGYGWQRSLERRMARSAQDQLDSIAALKAHSIAAWREDHIRDGTVLQDLGPDLLQDVRSRTADARLAVIARHLGYSHALLLSAGGEVEWACHAPPHPPGPEAARLARQAARQRRPLLSDLYRERGSLETRLDLFVPLVDATGSCHVALLRVDAARRFFPMVQSWPTPSPSAEVLLVRREGDRVLYLNELRHRSGTALAISFPVDAATLPAARLVSGRGVAPNGADYRGVPVLYAGGPVPDSPWVVVAKVDRDEVLAPLGDTARLVALVTGLLFVTCSLAALLIFWRRQAKLVAERHEAYRALRETEERHRIVTENAHDMIWLLDRSGRAFYVNPAVTRNRGFTLAELRELPLPRRLAAASIPTFEAAMAEVLSADGAAVTRTIEVEMLRKKGDPFWAEVSLAPAEHQAGQAVGVVAVARDISDRRQAEAEIQRLNAGLERRVQERTSELTVAVRELESFAYAVSHDLRTPLRAMDGFGQALLDEYGDRLDATGREYLDRVRAGSRRMGRLIDDLLRLSRISRGEIRREPFDLGALAHEVVAELREADPDRAVEFSAGGDLMVTADARLVRVLLGALLANAWKFTSQRPDPRVDLGSSTHFGLPSFYVRDNGAGFDPDHAAHLFRPFHRLHTEAEFPGIGIGLATAARVVTRHGGRIWAEGAVDQGATFWFTLD